MEQAAKHAMKYNGRYFVEFLRRVIDFPRKGVIDPSTPSPNFAELVNERIAKAYGARLQLPKGIFFDLDPQALSQPSKSEAKQTYRHSSN